VHSTVRRLIDPDAARPDYTGMLGFEAVARHRVDLPPDTGIFAFDTGVHYRCMPSPGGTSWSANLHWKRPMTSAEARAVPAEEWLRRLYDAFDDDDLGREFMRTTDPAGLQIVGPLYAMPPVRHWHRGRMVLVGDAVHAPSNVSGQGASLAVESAVQLARCLRDLPDVPAAFAAYERLRRRRVETIAARATRRIKRLTPSGPATRSMLQTLVPLMLKTVLTAERTLAPEQRHDIDWDAPVSAKPIAC
jgi:2-polyprenyl-6-methoxyphenol hydroxylase-like FAD-dependent oxidoreductase